MRLALAAILMLAGCAASLTPRPTEVDFAPNGDLTVRLSDWQRCTGTRELAIRRADGWSGTLEGCSPAYRYDVALEPNAIRSALGRLFGFFPGMGVVTVSDNTGRAWRFDVPPPLPSR
ncbi:hypothetical protein [Halodurantibacterium flavum]|uniref:Lipoprotein n=1 Tax=Halodurantibacterium flavum TaxID=1382802 RepID=A0ABW4S2Q6_9RHOB